MVDPVWEHGEKRGAGFKCKYCGTSKSGGGATRFKDHLAHRGHDVIDCPSVPPAVKNFFISELDKIKAKKYERQQDRRRRDAAARSTQYVDLEGEEEEEEQDDELQQALRHSREEYEFRQRAGPRYERGGGSGSGQARDPDGGSRPIGRMFSRSRSHIPERARDYDLATASGPRQQRIDTGPWTSKGRTARELLGRAWSKACHSVGIPGRKVDDPYFRAAIIETQKQGK